MREIEVPTVKPELKKLILEALEKAYTSVSIKDGIATGNRYQSIALGSDHTTGFRSDREPFLDQIDFRGKRVLDLGANLGEISRAARARGAAVVDGFEYDTFFLEIADLINAYNGVTRVSFFARDITDASVYNEHYDVVLALSVYVYLQEVLAAVSAITDGLLVLETHRLDGNLESTYMEPMGRFFPHHAILGTSDWGRGVDNAPGERAIIAFAKSDEALRKFVRKLGSPGGRSLAGRDLGTERDVRAIDVRRTSWYDRFFDTFAFNSPDELLAAVDRMQFDVDTLAQNRDLAKDLGGWVYWIAYLKGALQAARGDTVGPGNAYFDLLARHWRNDPVRAADLDDPDRLRGLVRRRFDDFELFRKDPEAPLKTAPIELVVTNDLPAPSAMRDVKRVYEILKEVPIETTTIDGYHRLFLARLFGHKEMPCDFVREQDAVSDLST